MLRLATLLLTLSLLSLIPSTILAASPFDSEQAMKLKGVPLAVPGDIVAEMKAAKSSLAARGYVERVNDISETEFALQRIKEREQESSETERRTGRLVLPDERGYYRIGLDSIPALPFALGDVPAELLQADSENYLISGTTRITRVYSKTNLGRLLIRDVKGAHLYAESGDVHTSIVGGFPVYLTTIKFHGDQWATLILAAKGQRIVQVEIGARIASAKQSGELDALVSSLLINL